MSWFDDQKQYDDADVVPAGAMPFLFSSGRNARCSWYGCALCDPLEAQAEEERWMADCCPTCGR